ncbi:MAG: putative toxin-antitoxin system toxin component, PIN family [Smithellaceae bacterium]|nr:putative toxin-antitoxin system toxin component, PIN family [Smithellaceae bacterium]
MTIRAVIDTNIWVSAILNPFGFPSRLRDAFANGVFQPVISETMLVELAEVLSRPRIKDKYGLATADIQELLVLIEERSETVVLSNDVKICRDINDNMVIETAIKGRAEYLVTRDDDIKQDRIVSSFLQQYRVSILSVADFLSLLEKQVERPHADHPASSPRE